MKKIWMTWIGVALSTTLLFGCSHEETIKKVNLTEQQQEEFLNALIDDAYDENIEPSELVKDLNKHIADLDEETASHAVNALLYKIHQFQAEMNVTVKGLRPQLKKYEEEGIDFNKESDIKKIDDKVLRAFLEQVQERLLKIGKENGDYVVVADFGKILSTYQSYLPEDITIMIELSKEESEIPYFDITTQQMNLDVIANRIIKMEKSAEKYPNSYYTEWMNKSKYFYYQHYFGMSGTTIADADQKLLPHIESHYQEMMKKHEGTQFAKDIALFFEEYKKNGNKVNTNVHVFLLDLTKVEHKSIVEEQASPSESQKDTTESVQEPTEDAYSDVKNAIRKVIQKKNLNDKKGA